MAVGPTNETRRKHGWAHHNRGTGAGKFNKINEGALKMVEGIFVTDIVKGVIFKNGSLEKDEKMK